MEEALLSEQDTPSSQSCGVCPVIGIPEIACTGNEALPILGTFPLCLITDQRMVTGTTRHHSSGSSRSDLRSASVILTLEPLSFLCFKVTNMLYHATRWIFQKKMYCLSFPPFPHCIFMAALYFVFTLLFPSGVHHFSTVY